MIKIYVNDKSFYILSIFSENLLIQCNFSN